MNGSAAPWIGLAVSLAANLVMLGYVFGVIRTEVRRNTERLGRLNGIDTTVRQHDVEIGKLRAWKHDDIGPDLAATKARLAVLEKGLSGLEQRRSGGR